MTRFLVDALWVILALNALLVVTLFVLGDRDDDVYGDDERELAEFDNAIADVSDNEEWPCSRPECAVCNPNPLRVAPYPPLRSIQ